MRRAAGVAAAVAVVLVFAVAAPPHRILLQAALCAVGVLAAGRLARREGTTSPRFWRVMVAMELLFCAFDLLQWSHAPAELCSAMLAGSFGCAAYAVFTVAPRDGAALRELRYDVPVLVLAPLVAEWQLFLGPYLDGTATTGGLAAAVRPGVTLLLVPLIVRAGVGGRRSACYGLIGLAALCGLGADLVVSFQSMRGHYSAGSGSDLLPLLSQVFTVASFLHPTSPQLGRKQPRTRDPASQTLWLLPVGVTTVLMPLAERWLGVQVNTGAAALTASVVMALLVGRCAAVVRRSEQVANHDHLTGLASRRAFLAALDDSCDAGTAGSVLLVDLDGFKLVNDAHGHDAGDAVLREVAQRLRAVIGPADVAARLGGDEFALHLPDRGRGATPSAVADDLLEALSRPFPFAGLPLVLAASIGIAPPSAGGSAEALLTAADTAMYVAKHLGKGRVQLYTDELRADLTRQRQLATELETAVEAGRGGGLVLHYQPLVELLSREVVGCEALLRWEHPRRGLLAAGEFLDLVGSADTARALDAFVLTEALHQLASWEACEGAGLQVSVNLSTPTLLQPDLVETVTAALSRSGVPASQLVLEVLEHEAVPDDPSVSVALRALSRLGVRIALDDFGAGYTSLAYLERFPIDALKVDRSLTGVSGAGPSRLLAALAGLGRSIDVSMLAEGIESEQQAVALAALGFRFGQGYHLGRPVPAAQFTADLRARRGAAQPVS